MTYTLDLRAVIVSVAEDGSITLLIPPARFDPANPQESLSATINPNQTVRGTEDVLRYLGLLPD